MQTWGVLQSFFEYKGQYAKSLIIQGVLSIISQKKKMLKNEAIKQFFYVYFSPAIGFSLLIFICYLRRFWMMTIQSLHFYVRIGLFVCMQNMESITLCGFQGSLFILCDFSARIWYYFTLHIASILLLLLFLYI